MGVDAWISLAVTAAIVAAMLIRLAGPDLIMVAALALLLATGVVPVAEALVGFSNEGVLTVAALFIVAAGLRETGGLDVLVRQLLGHPGSVVGAQLRLMWPVAALSAFMNNTPVVALMVPLVGDWSRRIGISGSKLLIPLSYASILGGTCTLIGTSTNLVVAGLARAHDPSIEIGMFDIAWIGVPATLVGLGFIMVASRWLLPDRGSEYMALDNAREYTVAMRVEPGSPIVGQSIEAAGLRHLPELFLVEIERGGHVIPAVSPEARLEADDVLLFAGVIESVVDLRRIRGLVPATDQVHKLMQPSRSRQLVEAVIAARSPLVGKSVREMGFRTHFNAAIIAVHRRGERIRSKVGDIVLEAGDTLLLEAHPSFFQIHRNDNTFALVSQVEGGTPLRHERAWIAGVLLVGMVTVNVLGWLPLLTSALLAAGGMVATRCVTGREARRSLDLQVLITIAAAFGVAAALSRSGAAGAVASGLLQVAEPLGPIGVLGALYVATAAFATLVGNNAAAALMFPVVASAIEATPGLDIYPGLFVLMIAASASFATPIGYQTNLMVLGPGRYRYGDFFRIGVPLQALVGLVAVTIAARLWL